MSYSFLFVSIPFYHGEVSSQSACFLVHFISASFFLSPRIFSTEITDRKINHHRKQKIRFWEITNYSSSSINKSIFDHEMTHWGKTKMTLYSYRTRARATLVWLFSQHLADLNPQGTARQLAHWSIRLTHQLRKIFRIAFFVYVWHSSLALIQMVTKTSA